MRAPTHRNQLRRDQRGLSTFEYAVLFVVIVIGALLVWQKLAAHLASNVGAGEASFSAMLGASNRQGQAAAVGDAHGSGAYTPHAPVNVSASAPGSNAGLHGPALLPRPTTHGPAAANGSSATHNGAAVTPRAAPSVGSPATTGNGAPSAANNALAAATPQASPTPPAATPSLWDRAKEYAHDSAPVQLGLGIVYGTVQALTPGGVLAPSPGHTAAFEYGRGAGEVATGIAQMVTGAGEFTSGSAAAGVGIAGAPETGGASVLVTVGGVALATEGVGTIALGTANTGAGVATIVHAATMSGEPTGSSPPPEKPPANQAKPETPPKPAAEAPHAGRVTGDALKAARKEFEQVKPKFWKGEAASNPGKYSPENLARMKQGKPPIGSDGYPMELHHRTPLAEGGSNSFDNLSPLTRTEHRLGENYKLNHPNLP